MSQGGTVECSRALQLVDGDLFCKAVSGNFGSPTKGRPINSQAGQNTSCEGPLELERVC
jgi:hypothetical protein